MNIAQRAISIEEKLAEAEDALDTARELLISIRDMAGDTSASGRAEMALKALDNGMGRRPWNVSGERWARLQEIYGELAFFPEEFAALEKIEEAEPANRMLEALAGVRR